MKPPVGFSRCRHTFRGGQTRDQKTTRGHRPTFRHQVPRYTRRITVFSSHRMNTTKQVSVLFHKSSALIVSSTFMYCLSVFHPNHKPHSRTRPPPFDHTHTAASPPPKQQQPSLPSPPSAALAPKPLSLAPTFPQRALLLQQLPKRGAAPLRH